MGEWCAPRERVEFRVVAALAALGFWSLSGCGGEVSRSAPGDEQSASGGRAAGSGGALSVGGVSSGRGGDGAGGTSNGSGGLRAPGGQSGGDLASAGGAHGGALSVAGGAPPVHEGGARSSTGGVAGASTGSAGELSAGAGGAEACFDLCTASAPVCCRTELRCVEDVGICQIDVLAGTSSNLAYDYSDLLDRVATLSGAVTDVIADDDVVSAASEVGLSPRYELRLNAAASGSVAALAHEYNRVFRVVCGQQTLFYGVLYPLEGQAAIQTPVLHVDASSPDAVVLRLGAWEGAWAGFGGSDPEFERLSARLDVPELRASFCLRGVMGELPTR